MAEQIRAPNSNFGVSVQHSVDSSPGRDTYVIEQTPMRAEMVLVINLANSSAYLVHIRL